MPETTSFRCLDGWTDPANLIGEVPGEHVFWLDAGVDAASGWSWIGSGEPADPPDPVVDGSSRQRKSRAEGAGPFVGGWVGWAGYDAAASRAGAPAERDAAEADALWLRVERFVAFDHAARRVWVAAPAEAVDDGTRRTDALDVVAHEIDDHDVLCAFRR